MAQMELTTAVASHDKALSTMNASGEKEREKMSVQHEAAIKQIESDTAEALEVLKREKEEEVLKIQEEHGIVLSRLKAEPYIPSCCDSLCWEG